jgi:glyoxylase-like metal-dependent hydrolase (beta-lactamase superfamily II)
MELPANSFLPGVALDTVRHVFITHHHSDLKGRIVVGKDLLEI